ncbi:hypothetical protein AUJ68_04320 [Candidatus Woesearchaeota archaeon CG1_02_57_44]|nr:MAG: hypothetical protein AUJ68_04320 [Candidatus Woesearchaeota archaeon CG1_02_57_44]PIN70995.1 MAG: hypothetical protein COV94_00150 [Candidatus Woesearchaeota archaeon CG11_big_fil_rev_8_21_14_0_20_57_5]
MGKGQASIFIIVGVVIVLLAGVAIFYARQSPQQQILDPTRPDAIRAVVDSCHRDLLTQGIQWIGLHGGRILPVAPKLFADRNILSDLDLPWSTVTAGRENLFIHYLYAQGTPSYEPGNEQMEADLGAYIVSNLPACVNEFRDFKNAGLQVEWDAPSASVTISDTTVKSDLTYGIRVLLPDSVLEFNDFTVQLDSQLGRIWNVMVPALLSRIDEKPDFMPSGKLTDLGEEYAVNAGGFPYQTSYVYYIIDKGEVDLDFLFAQERP